ncbi:YezD family protein [Neobacillus niacini]|uniref:YezD family protein n=1 Tax=Neobacillus niacini TaxID=86668 RepID=UPI0021CB50F3|nr:YezD family protein [Neobacillus niacini]MCM3767668.1 YezD family protein [Neobacillus niacini]
MSLKGHLDQQVLDKITSLLNGLEFGTIQITVHDSQITQIDRLEKHRLPLQKKANSQSSSQRKI